MKLFAKKNKNDSQEIQDDNSWFDELDIDVNEYASDIILITEKDKKSYTFKNNTTGEVSNNLYDVVRDGHRFIVKKEWSINIYGYLILNDKEHDALIILTAEAIKQKRVYTWQVCEKVYITRGGRSCGLLDDDFNIPRFPETDIGGQAVVDDDFNKITYFHNNPVFSKKEVLDYFGGFRYGFYRNPEYRKGLLDLFTKDGIKETLRTYRRLELVEKMDRGQDSRERNLLRVSDYNILSLNMDDRKEQNATIPIPDEAMAAIRDYTKRWLEDAYLASTQNDKEINELECVITIMQKYKGYAVQRFFIPYVHTNTHFSKSSFDVIETQRVWYAKNIDMKHMRCSEEYQYMNNFILWHDDLKGTVFEYATFLIDDFANMFKEELRKSENSLIRSYNLAEKNFTAKYGIMQEKIAVVSIVIGTNHVFEKLVKKIIAMMDEETDKNRKENIGDSLQSVIQVAVRHPFGHFPEHVYGRIDMSQTELHKALGVPKAMLNIMIETDRLTSLNDLKGIFSLKQGHRNYFMKMNKEACLELFNATIYPVTSSTRSILRNLIMLKGVEGLHNYITFINSLPCEEVRSYLCFTNMLTADAVGPRRFVNIDWNVKGTDLQDIMASIEALTWAEKEDKNGSIGKRFVKASKEWKNLSYSDDGYVVVCPKKAQDLVLEGIRLRHCVKEFIDPVCKKETVILFIRREEEPEKSFFTLEVKNGEIRQCSGFANCRPDEKLRSFIHQFCEAKDLKCNSDLRRCYGPLD